MTPVTLTADPNESNTELQVRLFLNNVINQACNLTEERHIPYTPGHEIWSKFSSTPPTAPPSISECEVENLLKMLDMELHQETNVNEVIDDVPEIPVEFLLNIAEKTLDTEWQSAREHMKENLHPKPPAANTQLVKPHQIPSKGAKLKVAYKDTPSAQGMTPHPKPYSTPQESLYFREKMKTKKTPKQKNLWNKAKQKPKPVKKFTKKGTSLNLEELDVKNRDCMGRKAVDDATKTAQNVSKMARNASNTVNVVRGGVNNLHRYRPSTVAPHEIHRYQRLTRLLI